MKTLKKVLKKLIKNFLKLISYDYRGKYFASSKKYWQDRYLSNGTSGPGSYGKLSLFKAKVINDFVDEKNIKTVLDFGCGDGNQLRLAKYDNYIGVDVSDKAIELCKKMFAGDTTKNFYNLTEFLKKGQKFELVLSMDVIYHLLEDKVFNDYMNNLFSRSKKYVIIYSSNYDKYIDKHVRCRKFTNWIDANLKDEFQQIKLIKNIYPFDENKPDQTSISDFFIYERVG